MAAPDLIQQLVQRFEDNRALYRSGNYNEARLRLEFLDPFFKALGWDLNNEQGYAEAYKDVIVEDSLEVEGAAKAPDYAIRIGGTGMFFVEAKIPSRKGCARQNDLPGGAHAVLAQAIPPHTPGKGPAPRRDRIYRPGHRCTGLSIVWVDRGRDQDRRSRVGATGMPPYE